MVVLQAMLVALALVERRRTTTRLRLTMARCMTGQIKIVKPVVSLKKQKSRV